MSNTNKPSFFKNLSDAFSKLSRGYIIFILLFIPCFFLGIFLIPSGSVSSNLFYRPLYFIVGQSFYSSFYVQLVKNCIFLVLILLMVCFTFVREILKPENKFFAKSVYIILSTIVIVGSYFFVKDVIMDIKIFKDGGYERTQCKLSSVSKGRGKSKNYHIWADKTLELNAYQYRELEGVKKQYEDKNINPRNVTIKVNYMPNTKCVLNYVIE